MNHWCSTNLNQTECVVFSVSNQVVRRCLVAFNLHRFLSKRHICSFTCRFVFTFSCVLLFFFLIQLPFKGKLLELSACYH